MYIQRTQPWYELFFKSSRYTTRPFQVIDFHSLLTYTNCFPLSGAYVLYVYWSEQLVPKCPYKITATSKGASGKVKVTGQGLKGGYVGQELHLDIDTTEAGLGKFYMYICL